MTMWAVIPGYENCHAVRSTYDHYIFTVSAPALTSFFVKMAMKQGEGLRTNGQLTVGNICL